MFDRLKKLFGATKPQPAEDPTAELAEAWNDQKSKLMEAALGPEHNMVMHAMIPFAVGGFLDLYYYPHGLPGTAVATKELSELPGQGSSNEAFSSYELAMFTRHTLNLDEARDESTAFGQAHATINRVLNHMARYSVSATLNRNETCAFPVEMKHVGGKCLIFDAYGIPDDGKLRTFGILAVIEVHPSEMDFARAGGGSELIARLKNAGHYPYSDLDREPVV
ncbi:MAG: hypothetical protein V4675_09420 [Verrucomicrobiota bacterium]